MNVGTSGAAPTTAIDLSSVTTANVTSAKVSGSSIIVMEGSQTVATVNLSAAPPANTYVDWISDGGSGTEVFLSTAPCYCRGTMIATPDGEAAIEELAIGDLVMTLSGAVRPIRWIGHRGYDGRFIAGNPDMLPIRIIPGALGQGVPTRDLYLSPEHALYLDGVLVPARQLLNGATITQAETVERVEYFHIELDDHDVIFAEGAPAETYVDCDNRLMFANGGEYARLDPDDERESWRFCLPRLGPEDDALTEIRAALLWHAEALRYQVDDDPDPHLIVDGERISPLACCGRSYRFAIPAGSGAVWLASRSVVPAETGAGGRDTRRLGVAVERIVLYDEEQLIEAGPDHPDLCEGFHDTEATHRWTDGMARLPAALLRPFAGPLTLDLYLASCELPYRIAAPIPPARAA
jgi:hypothetical protein